MEGQRSSDGLTLVLVGELDIASAPELEDRLTGLAAAGRAIRFDLSGVTFIDSVGLAVLVRHWTAASRDGVASAVDYATLRPQVARLFELAGVTEILSGIADGSRASSLGAGRPDSSGG